MKVIRLAQESDAENMLSIYAPIVRETAISFEVEPPSIAQFQQRIRDILKWTPWLVCEIDGKTIGYAYAGKHRQRAAYQWCVESSVYVGVDSRGKGVGKALYTSLLKVLQLQGFYNVYAGITVPNPASVALHEAVGFSPVGVYQLVGYKLGKWYDVGWWQLSLKPEKILPVTPPFALSEVKNCDQWQESITIGLSLLPK